MSLLGSTLSVFLKNCLTTMRVDGERSETFTLLGVGLQTRLRDELLVIR